jgi:hypothetical protein
MQTEYRFTDLTKAHAWYYACSLQGLGATLETVTPCKEWRVVVYS